jgi:MraZ protein
MQYFTGQYERTIDSKNRLQLPAQHRGFIEPERDGDGVYVTLGENPGTLSLYTPKAFEARASSIETEYMEDARARKFEMQFYASACFVEVDKQGRLVLPDRLRKKARLGEEVYLVGQKNRIDIWNRSDFDRSMGIDWEGDAWPDWTSFLRMKPPAAERN